MRFLSSLISNFSRAREAIAARFPKMWYEEIPSEVLQILTDSGRYKWQHSSLDAFVGSVPSGVVYGELYSVEINFPVNDSYTPVAAQRRFEQDVRDAYEKCGLKAPARIPGSERACTRVAGNRTAMRNRR